MEARLVAGVEVEPARVCAGGIVGKDCLEAFGGGSGQLDQFIATSSGNCPVAAKNALLHSQFAHLPQDHCGGANIGPEHDRVHARIFDHLKLAPEVGVAGHEFLLDHHWVAEPARCVAELDNSKTAVAIVHPQNRDPLQAELSVNVARQRVALHAVILDVGEVPGDGGFGDGGIGGRAVHQRSFGFQRQAKGDVRGFRTNGAEHCPNLVVIDHPDRFVRGSSPNGGIFCNARRGAAVLPVVIVVVGHQAERLAAVTPGSVRFVNRHVCAVQHAIAEHLVGVVVERRQDADTNLIHVLEVGVGDVASRTVVLDKVLIELEVRSGVF